MKRHFVKIGPPNSGWKEEEIGYQDILETMLEAKADHNELMADCVTRARELLTRIKMQTTNHDIIRMATAIYTSEAFHTHYYLDDVPKKNKTR